MSSIRLTEKQYKRMLQGSNVTSIQDAIPTKRPSQPRQERTPEQQTALVLIRETRAVLRRVASLCAPYGWQCDAIRAFTTDPRDEQYAHVHDYAATPNAIQIWNERYNRRLGFLWEFERMSDEDIEKRLMEAIKGEAK